MFVCYLCLTWKIEKSFSVRKIVCICSIFSISSGLKALKSTEEATKVGANEKTNIKSGSVSRWLKKSEKEEQ